MENTAVTEVQLDFGSAAGVEGAPQSRVRVDRQARFCSSV